MHTRDKDAYKISFATRLPIVPVRSSTAPISVGFGSFCVPFVFQGVSNFCSDTLFKLQNITLVIKGVYYCGATQPSKLSL